MGKFRVTATRSVETLPAAINPQDNFKPKSLFYPIKSFNALVHGDESNCLPAAKKIFYIAFPLIVAVNLLMLPFIAIYNFYLSSRINIQSRQEISLELSKPLLTSDLTRLLDEWMNNPSAVGDKTLAITRIKEAFQKNSSTLTLNSLNLNFIPKEIFSFLPNLQELYLFDNQLTAFDCETDSFPSLQELYLNNNQLTSFEYEAGSFPSLQRLSLAGNRLTAFNCKTGSFPSLQQLNLFDNQLTTFDCETGSFPHLKGLRLAGNRLTAFDYKTGSFPSLQGLYLNNNQLTTFDCKTGSFPFLQKLYLFNNQLTAFDCKTGSFPSLQELSLNNNQLTAFNCEIGSFPFLQKLSLAGNRLTTLPTILKNISTLIDINYYNNAIPVGMAVAILDSTRSLRAKKSQINYQPY